MRSILSLGVVLTLGSALCAQPPQIIAPTGPLAPADERKAFTVPAGFEVQLAASEPDIQKPIQMAFDAKGRLWVTTSFHYPFAAKKGEASDKLFILSDFGPDGKAGKVQVFSDKLNIPIGILPLPDCQSCIVSSVGEILKLTDTDGDGKADKTEVLFSGFGTRDTHGMYNSFTLMPDGWVYACHGFSNDSRTKGTDGHEVHMQSGNTFRFRPDGSRIEVFTRGQVNPFGIAIDPWFNLYTADCHSKPITQLIRGAVYQSFGKPDDGLGFAPHVTPHDHGSTALCGLTWYEADQFPKQYRGCMFLGNVVTNRVNFDRIEWKGSTPVAKELPDFLTSKDPWFRPTDIKLGPDGALYVADFYNKIIGHYEVDLRHPGRDKTRGRVWRIVWKGEPGATPPKTPFTDLTTEKADTVDKLLGHPNLTVRLFATRELLRRKEPLPKEKGAEPASQEYAAHRLWVDKMPRPGADERKRAKITIDPAARPLVATHQIRIETAVAEWQRQYGPKQDELKEDRTSLAKLPPQVARADVDQMTEFPSSSNVRPLVELLKAVSPEDTHLRHAARIALRNQLRNINWADVSKTFQDDAVGDEIIADAAVAFPTSQAAAFLAGYLIRHKATPAFPAYAKHIGHYGDDAERRSVLRSAGRLCGGFPNHKATENTFEQGVLMHRQFLMGMQAGGHKLSEEDASWFRYLSDTTLPFLLKNPAAARLAVEVLGLLPTVSNAPARILNQVIDDLTKLASMVELNDDVRGIALDTLSRRAPMPSMKYLIGMVNDPQTRPPLKEKALIALSNVPSRDARSEVNVTLKGVPYRVAFAVAQNMVASQPGTEGLLASVKAGFMPARVLQEKAIADRIRAYRQSKLNTQVADLTKGLPPADQKLAAIIKQRAAGFPKARPDKGNGAKLFVKHCAACHQIGGQGGKVGPNLDGIAARGIERLLEDVIDPNRNVDAAFRTRVLNLVDGTTKTGLMLRVEGEVLVLADSEGKEFRIPTKDIEANRETALSPMPTNFGEVLSESEFYDLMAYLLDQKMNPRREK